MKQKSISISICAELKTILDYELAHENTIISGPEISNWPRQGTVFISLKNDLKIKEELINKSIVNSVCTDMHFGWHNECFCEEHNQLLVAGSTHINSNKY